MIRFSLLLRCMFLCTFFLFARSNQSSHTFLFSIKPEVQPLQLSLQRETIHVEIEELNHFFQENDIIRVEPWLKSATESDRDGNIYLNRIYRVYIDKNSLNSVNEIISSMKTLPFIQHAKPEQIRKPYFTPNDYNSSGQDQYSIENMKVDHAWEYWSGDSEMPGDDNILYVSVDTGVDYTHPDLLDNIWINQGEIEGNAYVQDLISAGLLETATDGSILAREIDSFVSNNGDDLNGDGYKNIRDVLFAGSVFLDNIDNDGNGKIDDLIGWDMAGYGGIEDNDPYPKEGLLSEDNGWHHGTHVAGILCATTNNSIGMVSPAYNGKIMSIKCAMDNESENEPSIYGGFDGILYAAQTGSMAGLRTIINCSWGGSGYDVNEQAVINVAYNTYNAIIVAAAGNGIEGSNNEEYAAHYPSSYDNIVSISALGRNGHWGEWATYHPTIDLGAPGENIYSTLINANGTVRYGNLTGSSMASPNAASVMGLVWSFHDSWSNDQIINKVISSADTMIYNENPLWNNEKYKDCNGNEGENCLGAGIVDAQRAIGSEFSPYIILKDSLISDNQGDGDGVINPGEIINFILTLENIIGWIDAENVNAILSTNHSKITIVDNNASYGNITSGSFTSNTNDTFEFIVATDIDIGSVDFTVEITGTGSSSNYQYTDIINLQLSVSLNQYGFPLYEVSQKTSPLSIDFDNDGDEEIIFGDYNGKVHVYHADGAELTNDIFPFDTGNQIWGAMSGADMDGDGLTDIAVVSKNKHFYLLDIDGVKVDFDSQKFLLGTPAIGNLDDDMDLEVVFSGYSAGNMVYALNPDGSDVEGFPIDLGEKVKIGVALADFNGNGKDDIVVGTDDNHVHLFYDDGTEAPGFPFVTGDKVQAAPAILDVNGEKIILAGCNDNTFYAINADGSLRFSVATTNKVFNSPAFLEHNGMIYIFFSDDSGMLYAVDTAGNALSGWPIDVGEVISKSVAIADMDNDGEAEVIGVTELTDVVVYNLDGSSHDGFPMNEEFPFLAGPMVMDMDGDGDLEILGGSVNSLVVLDIKSAGTSGYWNMYRGNNYRDGYYDSSNYESSLIIDDLSLSKKYSISNIYPNPFNPITTIQYTLPENAAVEIVIFNILGQLMEELVQKFQITGTYSIDWDASDYSSGIYFVSMRTDKFYENRKILLVK